MGNVVKICPKCGFTSDIDFDDCPKCGVIISKFLKRERELKEFEEREAIGRDISSENLAGAHALIIKQQKEWVEILSGFETKNKYEVMNSLGNHLFQAEEEGGSFSTIITHILLTALRPFTMHIFSPQGIELFTF
ncbi:MAG: phospholipid scramblase-related protein [Thermodesulfobacteriota bacterium]